MKGAAKRQHNKPLNGDRWLVAGFSSQTVEAGVWGCKSQHTQTDGSHQITEWVSSRSAAEQSRKPTHRTGLALPIPTPTAWVLLSLIAPDPPDERKPSNRMLLAPFSLPHAPPSRIFTTAPPMIES